MKFLIFGLGNIGIEYSKTRHNIGFLVLDAYSQASNISFTPQRYGDVAEHRFKGNQIVLIKPSTYMNLSGKAVRYWMQKLNVEIENVLIICDDINLPMGKIRIRKQGSDGGHNGLKNITEILGHSNFYRVRYGIGKEFATGEQADYVLGKWTTEEIEVLPKIIPVGEQIIKTFVTMGIEKTMNQFNNLKV